VEVLKGLKGSESVVVSGTSKLATGVPVEVKAKVIRMSAASYGTMRVGVSITEQKDSWMRLFVAWVADDNINDGVDE